MRTLNSEKENNLKQLESNVISMANPGFPVWGRQRPTRALSMKTYAKTASLDPPLDMLAPNILAF